MNCPKCGKENPEGCKFCAGCGTSLQTQAPAPTYTPPAQPPQQTYVPPVQAPFLVTEQNIPSEYKPIGAWMYLLWNIVFSIPVVGLVMLIIFSFGGTSNINLRNYARSYFCAALVVVIVVIVAAILTAVLGVSLSSAFAGSM